MNNGGTPGAGQTIIGFFTNMLNQQHGYLVRNGMLESYDPTAATTVTAIWDINASQQFVGTYRESGEAAAKRHAFLQRLDDSAPSHSTSSARNQQAVPVRRSARLRLQRSPSAVNPQGVIVGQYVLVSGGAPHGFVAIPRDMN
jgi:hypothetical protein